jgi:hypothetical protein
MGHGEEYQVCRCADARHGVCLCCNHQGGSSLHCGLIHAKGVPLQPAIPHFTKFQYDNGSSGVGESEGLTPLVSPPVSRFAAHFFPEHYGGAELLFQLCRLRS